MVHGAIERILKAFIIKKYGIELLVHETKAIYDSINEELNSEINRDNYSTLSLLDNNFILYRYPTENRFYSEDMIDMAFEALIDINSIVEDSLDLSNRAIKVIKRVENEISVDKNRE
ncbi:HEPN domain-containing protein [Clostridium botulinum]|uniref:HEPN domain-containing protein n=1 Tax=Clostridium botulinum TaxID=1491 RepID=UPI002246E8E9|nr:HEPN domain-containing protein [Clostridium botulinum]